MHRLSPRYRRQQALLKLFVAVVVLAAAVLIGVLMKRTLDVPVVHRTWPSGECVRVIDDSAKAQGREPYTCQTVPERHESFWVEGNRS